MNCEIFESKETSELKDSLSLMRNELKTNF